MHKHDYRNPRPHGSVMTGQGWYTACKNCNNQVEGNDKDTTLKAMASDQSQCTPGKYDSYGDAIKE